MGFPKGQSNSWAAGSSAGRPPAYHPHIDPLAKELLELARRRRITRLQLEKLSGIGRGSLGDWVVRGVNPKIANLRAVAGALGFELTLKPMERADERDMA